MFVSDFLHQSWIILRGPLLTKNPSSGVSSQCIGIRNPMWGTSQYPFDWVQTNSPSSHMPKFFWLKEFLRFKIEIKKCHNWCPVFISPLLSCNLTFFLSSVFSLFKSFLCSVISLFLSFLFQTPAHDMWDQLCQLVANQWYPKLVLSLSIFPLSYTAAHEQALTGTRYPTLPGFYFYYPYPTRNFFENFRVQGII